MPARPVVSVIVPTFDGREFLAECLPGLRAQSLPLDQFEIVVVDNGSTDGTAEWLGAEYPATVVVRLSENLGFAEGVNRGAAIAKGELLVFLNNDTFPEPDFLAELIEAAGGADPPDCVAARILNWEGDGIEFGGASLNVFGFGAQHSSWQPRFSETKAGDPLPFACGGAMLIRADAFRDLGGFDPDYFAYYEDVDLGWRLWLSGRRVVYAPAAEVRHRRHATGERFSTTWRHFHWYRNALLTLIKNSDEELLPHLLPFAFIAFFQRIGALYHSAAQASAAGDVEQAQFLLGSAVGGADGISWILDHLEAVWDKRRSVQALRRVPDRALADILDIRLDFGAEGDASENARALRLLPFVDLSALMTPDRAEAAAMAAASRIAEDARKELEKMRPELVAWHAEASRLGRELHARNLELAEARRRLDEILSSRSWRWTAAVRWLIAAVR